jgi:hypothetical protein
MYFVTKVPGLNFLFSPYCNFTHDTIIFNIPAGNWKDPYIFHEYGISGYAKV